jgi:hypothetical protein
MATLTTTISENLVLNGTSYSSTQVKTIASITQVVKTVIEVPVGTAKTLDVIGFASAASGLATLDQDDVRYCRITNLDATNFVCLGIEDTSGDNAYYIKVDAGRSYILPVPNDNSDADFTHPSFFADDSGHTFDDSSENFVDVLSITAHADTAVCKIELMIALDTTT